MFHRRHYYHFHSLHVLYSNWAEGTRNAGGLPVRGGQCTAFRQHRWQHDRRHNASIIRRLFVTLDFAAPRHNNAHFLLKSMDHGQHTVIRTAWHRRVATIVNGDGKGEPIVFLHLFLAYNGGYAHRLLTGGSFDFRFIVPFRKLILRFRSDSTRECSQHSPSTSNGRY